MIAIKDREMPKNCVIDRIAYAVKKRQQKRINDAFKEEAE